MSPASKSKSKDKLAAKAVKEQAKAVKEQPKASLKSTPAPPNSGNGVPGSAYNPISGTFHTLETAPSASLPPPPNNGRFRTIDETDNHSSSSLGTTAEYDSLSNNDSCSGESEDQKDKTTTNSAPRIESIPGSDTDKRDKIRQKNERKHQRQREKRAQELHERCSGYLMSRKLEMLAQKLVAMGFSLERATMALILNEGRVEESVAWLFEGGEDSKNQTSTNLDGANLKIDIADELAQISALEIKYKCTKQEVERAVVTCEGDLEKAADVLKAQKQEQTMAPPKPEQISDHVASASDLSNKLASSVPNPGGRTQVKGVASIGLQQQKRDEWDFNYTKPVATVGQIESTNRNLQSSRKTTTKQEVTRPQFSAAALDKRRPTPNPGPSVPYSPVSPLQVVVPQAKPESRYAIGGGHEVYTNGQTSTLKEPIIMMQRPQSIPPKQSLPSTSISQSVSPPVFTGWYPNGTTNVDVMKMAVANGGLGHQLRNLSRSGSTSQQLYPQNHQQPFVSSPSESTSPGWGGSWSATGSSTRTSSIAMPSSLGLFTGWGSLLGSSGSVDWSTGGSVPQCDYANVDWSLESTPLMPSALKSNRLYDSRTTTLMGAKVSRPAVVDSGMCLGGLQDVSLVTDPSNSVGSHEWTSPFNGRDLFRAPRQFVTSPSP